jgi:hypothetical protein
VTMTDGDGDTPMVDVCCKFVVMETTLDDGS